MAALSFKTEQSIAHRGNRQEFPENSLIGIVDAIAAGAGGIEFDIQLSKDGIPLLFHDAELDRLCGQPGRVFDFTLEQLRDFNACEPERLGKRFKRNPINTLSDIVPIIKYAKRVKFFLELKEESLAQFGQDACFKALRDSLGTIADNICFISFNLPAVKRARQEGFSTTILVFRDWQNRDALLAEAEADAGFINYTRIPESEPITAAKPILLYEVSDRETAQSLLARGAAGVESFNIRELLQNP